MLTAGWGCARQAGSCPRAERLYGPEEHLTLEALQMEIQEKNEVMLFDVPGHVLRGGIRERCIPANCALRTTCLRITPFPRGSHGRAVGRRPVHPL